MKFLVLLLGLSCPVALQSQAPDIKRVEAAGRDLIVAARREGYEGVKSLLRPITVDEKDPSYPAEKSRVEILRSFADGLRSLDVRVTNDSSLASKDELFARLTVAAASKGGFDPSSDRPWITATDRALIWEFRFPYKIDDTLWPERRKGIVAARWYMFFVLEKGQVKLDRAVFTILRSLP